MPFFLRRFASSWSGAHPTWRIVQCAVESRETAAPLKVVQTRDHGERRSKATCALFLRIFCNRQSWITDFGFGAGCTVMGQDSPHFDSRSAANQVRLVASHERQKACHKQEEKDPSTTGIPDWLCVAQT